MAFSRARRLGALLASALALRGAAVAQSGEARVDPRVAAALSALAAKDLRVAGVAYRLQTAAVNACQEHTALPGLIVQDAAQYREDLRPAMAALYHLGPYPAVTGVVPGGPADRAGIRAGDEVLALDGAPIGSQARIGRKANGDAYGAIVDRIAAVFARGQGSFTLRRAGASFTRVVVGTPACASSVQLDLDPNRNAGADGHTVSVSQGMLDFTRTDDELAFVIGHELAHNILGHRSFLDSTRKRQGLLGNSNVEVLETERQADYWGLYIVAWAGYDITQIPPFWERIAHSGWLSGAFDTTHPGNATRVHELAREVREIQAAKAAGRAPVPNFQAFSAASGS